MDITPEYVKSLFPPRDKQAHKGDFGKLLVICGSRRYRGAAVFAAAAASRCGAGIVTLASVDEVCSAAACFPEIILEPLAPALSGCISDANIPLLLRLSKAYDAVVLGCGLSNTPETANITRAFIELSDKPILLDADSLNALAGDFPVFKSGRQAAVTPHMIEMSRICCVSSKEISQDRKKAAADFAKKHHAATLLKGHGTVVSSQYGEIMINTTGNAGMAKGGSGDVLAGAAGAFMARGLTAFEALSAAAYLHGLAGDIACEKYGENSMLPSDTLSALPQAFLKVLR